MSKARDEYYSKCYKEGCDWKEDAINYIEELEKSDKQNIIIIGEYALRIDRLEQQKAELLEFAKIAHRVSGLADKEDYGITLLYKKSIELLIKYK